MAAADQHQPKPTSGSPRNAALVVGVTTTVQALATMCTLVPATIAPELARAFGVPAAMIGFQVSLIYAGALVMSLIGGQLVRRLGAHARVRRAPVSVHEVGDLAPAQHTG